VIVHLKNLLLAREPHCGVARWAARGDLSASGRQSQLISALSED
jgi:hypothetical protein